jgi:nucleoside-diphosphate-sugar epimerase
MSKDPHNPRHFFITGGSGFLGINMVRYLLERGHEVTSYDIAPFDYPEKNQIKAILGDIRDPELLEKSMQGSDIVLHFAAALPLYSEKDIYTTDVDGTRNVLEAAKQLGIKRVIFTSSTSVYGVPEHHPLYETDPMVGVGPYGQAKIDAEGICDEYRQKGLCVPILRPKSFIGPERLGVFALFYDWAKDGHGFPILGNGRNRYQLMDVEDMCSAVYACATLPDDKVNDVFNVGAEIFTTMREDYQAVLDEAGFGKKIVGVPAGPAIFILRILEKLHLSPLYAWVYATAAKDSFVSIDKAKKVLGFAPKYSNKDALIRNYRWYLSNLQAFEGKSGVTHRVPWKQGVLRFAKIFF